MQNASPAAGGDPNTISLRHRLLVAAAGVALVVSGVFATAELSGVADAKKKKSFNSRVGNYRGTTETGRTVSFTYTKNRRIVNFLVPNATLYCGITPPPGTSPRPPDYEKGTVNITAPPIPITGFAKFEFSDPFPGQGVPYARNFVDGKPDGGFGNGLAGNAAFGSSNGNDQTPGTETCATGILDWTARQVTGGKRKK